MIEKLMLENNFYCGRNADLSNSVFLFPWKPWTLHYKRLLFICYRQVSIEQIKKSIIHLAPCSQEIIDNENPILIRFFLEDAK
jgi:predicted ATP-grasp superfamily ATP-dependent carboligase